MEKLLQEITCPSASSMGASAVWQWGYFERLFDTIGIYAVDQIAVGQVPDVIDMIKDEEVLRQNESFEPDDELPF